MVALPDVYCTLIIPAIAAASMAAVTRLHVPICHILLAHSVGRHVVFLHFDMPAHCAVIVHISVPVHVPIAVCGHIRAVAVSVICPVV